MKSLLGRRFAHLRCITPWKNDTIGRRYWLCLCDCGTYKVIKEKYFLYGNTKSCGCLVRGRPPNVKKEYKTSLQKRTYSREHYKKNKIKTHLKTTPLPYIMEERELCPVLA